MKPSRTSSSTHGKNAMRAMVAALCLAIVGLVVTSVAAEPAYATLAHKTGAAVTSQATRYDIVYRLNGGTQATNQVTIIKKGRTLKISKLRKPKRALHKFVGWYSNRALTQRASVLKGSSSAKERTVYAKWKRTGYNILYSMNGGLFTSNYAKSIGKDKTLRASKLAKPVRPGYTFAGWYTDKNLKTKAKVLHGVANSTKRTVYAKWNAKTYSISYEPNGGTLPSQYIASYITTDGVPALPTPTRTGYSFIGWYSDPQLTTIVPSISAGDYGNKTLYARWAKRIAIAHRGYYAGGTAPNSIAAYEAAAEKGFTYVETDIRFTADGKPVLSHDDSIPVKLPDANGNPIGHVFNLKISSVTLEQLQNDYIAEIPAGPSVVTPDESESAARHLNVSEFGEFLDACKRLRLIPIIELKEGTQAQIESLVTAVDARKMTDAVQWASFQFDLLGYVQAIHPGSSFVMLTQTVTNAKLRNAQLIIARGGTACIGAHAASATDTAIANCRKIGMPLGIWSLPDENDIALYPQYISSFTLNGIAASHLPTIL